jgi:hypothetical protein
MTEPSAPDAQPPKLRTLGISILAKAGYEHPTLMLTLAYLGLTFVGMLHDLWFYHFFRINILDFSDTSDFLLAAIRNPLVIILALAPIGILLVFQQLRASARKKSDWYDKYADKYSRSRWNSVFWRVLIYSWFVIVYAAFFAELYAGREANRIKKGIGRRVTYVRSDGVRTDENPILLGTTARYVFFYSPATKTTEIVPVDALTALRVDSRRRKEREQDSLVFPDSLANPDSGQ